MVKRVAREVGSQLMEQGKHTGQAAKKATKNIFQRSVGQKTDDDKAPKTDQTVGKLIFGVPRSKKEQQEELDKKKKQEQQMQQATSQADIRRIELEEEDEAELKKLRNKFHKEVKSKEKEAEEFFREQEQKRLMEEEEERKKKQEEQQRLVVEKKKEEDLAVQQAKRAKGTKESGPKRPK